MVVEGKTKTKLLNTFTIVLSPIEVLEWIDKKYIKEQSIKYIKKL